MNTLVAYASKHGCTKKCAAALAEKLEGGADLYDLRQGQMLNLDQYDKIIIGGSIYMGRIVKEVNDFCTRNLNQLKNKKIGLFICGMREGEMAVEELKTAYPQELVHRASAKECFGGEFIFAKMNFLERFIVKKVSKVEKDVSNVSMSIISGFAQSMNHA